MQGHILTTDAIDSNGGDLMGSLIAGETNVNCSGMTLLSFAEDGGGDSMGTSLVSFATEDVTERESVLVLSFLKPIRDAKTKERRWC